MTLLTQAKPVERYIYTYTCTRYIPVVPVADDEFGERGEASGVRRNVRNWNDQLFDSRGSSLLSRRKIFLPVSFDLSSKKQVRESLASRLAVATISVGIVDLHILKHRRQLRFKSSGLESATGL